MSSRVWMICLLLFFSGVSALVYQICWLRDLRLVFGSSTVASSVVLAIFLGGLGLGGAFWGRIADRSARPLVLYAWLELLAGASALLTVLLLILTRKIYLGLGGEAALGPLLAHLFRMGLSILALGPPVFFLGGTMPAAVRVVENATDIGRRDIGLLYGINTFGGVVGVCLATFFMLEYFGTRNTSFIAAAFNILVGSVAFIVSFRLYRVKSFRLSLPKHFKWLDFTDYNFSRLFRREQSFLVYGVTASLGFAFILMELVWYRMLAPILGGTTYTFGLVLAVTLFGIAIGGILFAIRHRALQTSWRVLAASCGLQALCLIIPFALGDNLAMIASMLSFLGVLGFYGQVFYWFLIASVVVLPAAIVSGFQFPLVIGLLGRGDQDVGQQTGYAYAFNTFGAILGALVGGLYLLPVLSAPGCWKGVVLLLLLIGLLAAFASFILEKNYVFKILLVSLILVPTLMVFSTGPTAAWRHSGIGVARSNNNIFDRNQFQEWLNEHRRTLLWETEGVESSVGLTNKSSLAFVINGKVDGNARSDAGTQVMAPLIGAILHASPKKSLVIGLGTGSSAGWLAEIETMERVDVVEMEPAILEVARQSSPVNHDVLNHPRVQIIIGDGREFLLTSREKYDLIFSEPSNPYRVGISSLYTREFYEAAAARLTPDGMFSQWLQGYSVDTETVATIYATLSSVFPEVETWQTRGGDLLLLCSTVKKNYDVSRLRLRLAREPFQSALLAAWGVNDLEGFLSRYVAGSSFAKEIAAGHIAQGKINTDDRMLVEFGFARAIGPNNTGFSIMDLRQLARSRDEHRPDLSDGQVDWGLVDGGFFMMFALENLESPIMTYNYYMNGNYDAILAEWDPMAPIPHYPLQIAIMAEALAEKGDNAARPLIGKLREFWPVEAEAILARLLWRQGDSLGAYQSLESALLRYREDPWPQMFVMRHALIVASWMAADSSLAEKVFDLLSVPFSVYNLENVRLTVLLDIASRIDYQHGATVLAMMEPHIIWREDFLRYRFECYRQTGNPLTGQAQEDLQSYLKNVDTKFSAMFPDI